MTSNKKNTGDPSATVTLGEGVVQWQAENLEHIRYEYDFLNRDSVVYDLGSYKREFADEIERRYGCEVQCFDAINDNAAWLHDGVMTFSGSQNTISAFVDTGFHRQYKCVDIARVVREQIGRIDLMKINIEGGEYGVLTHIFNAGLMGKIKELQVQFHCVSTFDYKLLYEVIRRQLSLTHVVRWRYPFCWESWSLRNIDPQHN